LGVGVDQGKSIMIRTAAIAKTTRPSLAAVLHRERLFQSLDRKRRAALVWITGPAGAGKTTLAASYIDCRQSRSIWYQLDSADEDIGTFFHYMGVAALSRSGVYERPSPTYSAEHQGALGAFARRFFRALFASVDEPLIIVLDNYHEISWQTAFNEVLLVALGELPPGSSIFVLSRTKPPAELARARANRQIEVLGWNDLKLTRDEADTIVDCCGAPATDLYLEQLYQRTQGWAAGLILMLDQSAHRLDVCELEDEPPQVVFDYLAGEIFDNFDPTTQRMLLSVVYLPEMSASQAVALSQEPRAGELLAELHHNYHLVGRCHNPDMPVYHFHPLLVGLLRNRTRAVWTVSEQRAQMHRSASVLEQSGAWEEAITLRLEAGDWAGVARLIELHGADLINQGRTDTLEGWLSAIPDDRAAESPGLLLWQAECRAQVSNREARQLFASAFVHFEPDDERTLGPRMRALAGILDAIVEELDDLYAVDPWIEHANGLLAQRKAFPLTKGSEEDLVLRLKSSLLQALSWRRPEHPGLRQQRSDLKDALLATEDVSLRVLGLARLASEFARLGDWYHAADVVRDLEQIPAAQELTPQARREVQDARILVAGLGHRSADCMSVILQTLDNAWERVSARRQFTWYVHALLAALGEGDLSLVDEVLGSLRTIEGEARRIDRCTHAYGKAWLAALRNEEFEAVEHQKAALRLAAEAASPLHEVACRASLASLKAELGGVQGTVGEFKRLRHRARAMDRPGLYVQVLLLQAKALLSGDQVRIATRSLAVAFRLSRLHGLRRHQWWLPGAMADVCAFALRKGIEPDYVRQLIRHCDLPPPPAAVMDLAWPWRYQIFTLGEFKVLRDGKSFGLTARLQQKPLHLLKTLVALGGTNVPESKLIEALWPRIDTASAHRSLTTTLHRLRKLLSEDRALILKFGRLSLNPRYCWSDVWAFEALTTYADRESAGLVGTESSSLDARSLAKAVLDCYRGPFLNSEGDNDAFLAMRRQLRNRLLRAAGEVVRGWSEEGRWTLCTAFLARAIQADPDLEGLYRRLMLCYREAGQLPEAMDVYEQCRVACQGKAYVAPSPETEAVFKIMVQGI